MKKYIIFFVTIINFISFSCFVFSYEDCSIENSNYSADLNWAYIRACNNWLIVSKTINDSNLEERITRAELAKLMVLYNKVILSKTSILTWNIPYYTDVNQGIWSFFNYINLAYNYQIMWIYADGTPLKKFYPYKFVTRGEAATVLSRVFFWNKYNTWGVNFYSNHINRLKNEGILFNDDPLYIETKWSILLMLYNSIKEPPIKWWLWQTKNDKIILPSGTIYSWEIIDWLPNWFGTLQRNNWEFYSWLFLNWKFFWYWEYYFIDWDIYKWYWENNEFNGSWTLYRNWTIMTWIFLNWTLLDN